jgi:uncharacterized protein YabN with tetrapyrrole methylase and pyrophosphatase domain
MTARRRGSLAVVGIGIRAPEQTTLEASSRIRSADQVYSLVASPLAEFWIRSLNENTEVLGDLYSVGKPRLTTYEEMVERILDAVRKGLRVCVVSYGHPGAFGYPFHEAVRRSREEGFEAEMLAGISSEDCLFAEVGIDPGASGCRSYEATDFLVHRRGADTTSSLILWQIGVIAEFGYKKEKVAWNPSGLAVLAETLLEAYSKDHEVVVYEAARHPVCSSKIARIPLERLPQVAVGAMSTLYVPPMTEPDVDEAMLRRLGLVQSSGGSLAASPSG